ncbi:Transcription factor LBX1 [Folsomia candida]|uniref:Transcription factor LBX1 n=1 Tax=Folsomia candida TaxID=158441 RepID=A0A226DM84_FOLCA|nr:Transcription factor LBX1 [Folsomia candida]
MGPDKAIEDEGINAMNYYYGFLVSSFLLHQLTSFTICFEEHMFCGHVQAILLEMNAGLVLLIYTCRVIVHWVTKKSKVFVMKVFVSKRRRRRRDVSNSAGRSYELGKRFNHQKYPEVVDATDIVQYLGISSTQKTFI